MNAFARSVVVALAGALLWGACGGDDDSDDPAALCMQGCNKANACFGDSGFGTTDCAASCAPKDGGSGPGSCTNESAITAYKACLSKECAELLSCFQMLPPCEGGGTGGAGGNGGSGGSTSGTGGRAGTGGSGGTAGDAGGGTCAQLLACCNAATDATIKMGCLTAYCHGSGRRDLRDLAHPNQTERLSVGPITPARRAG